TTERPTRSLPPGSATTASDCASRTRTGGTSRSTRRTSTAPRVDATLSDGSRGDYADRGEDVQWASEADAGPIEGRFRAHHAHRQTDLTTLGSENREQNRLSTSRRAHNRLSTTPAPV